jgi:septal ring factor EnvC (AmiA/AmiB activator)
MSDEARAHLAHLAYIEAELQRHQMGINVLNVSRQRIGDMLRSALPAGTEVAAAAAAAPAAAAAKPVGKSPGKSARK